jgi:hypothetical protein
MFGLFGRPRWSFTTLIVFGIVLYVAWKSYVRPICIQISNYYWWMRP